MKTIQYIIYAILLFLMCTAVSCEDMLEAETPNNQITSDQVFETVQTANAALAGLYSGLWENSPVSGNQTGVLLGLYTDELGSYSTGSNSGITEIFENSLVDSNPTVLSYWTNAYQKIYMANAIMEGAENSQSLSRADKDRIRGEALIVRSLLFLYLQQIYGDIPYPVTTSYMINQSMSKTPSAEVLSRIESDLQEAVTLSSDQYRSTERIFPNRKTAQLMLAKVNMLQKKWNEAELLLKTIRQSPLYQFQNDLNKVFDKSGTHILWQLKPRNTNEPTKEAMSYYFNNSAPTTVALSLGLISSFTAGDLRRQHWTASVTVGSNTWYRASKYKNTTANPNEYSIVFRLEEVNLSLAEVLTRQGKTAEALPLINSIKQRAQIPLISGTVTADFMLDEILSERRKEFFTESGHRFFDLKRFGKLDQLTVIKPNWKSFHQLWPIPQKEILLNANLNPQNNGY